MRQVHLAGAEVDQLHAGDSQTSTCGCARSKAPRRGTSHLAAKEGGAVMVRRRPSDGGGQQAGGLGQAVEGFAQRGQGGLGRVGQQQALGRALEEGRADVVLEVLDLLADRARASPTARRRRG
jgi:hypothetical protein